MALPKMSGVESCFRNAGLCWPNAWKMMLQQYYPFPLRGLRQNPCLSAFPYDTVYFIWTMLCPGRADSIFSEINDCDADL